MIYQILSLINEVIKRVEKIDIWRLALIEALAGKSNTKLSKTSPKGA